uniref:RNA polymerase alpha subunit n=1 Tax=Panagrolaimus davidi TaxID=227884 RepID=A0A914P281_9BILA
MSNDKIVSETEEDQFYFETAVSLEALFKALPNVKFFEYMLPFDSLNIITTKTVEELLKIPHFLSLDQFEIREITEIFDIKSFYGHIKENKKTKIFLDFSFRQLPDEYVTELQTIVDEILETENRDYKVPRIEFSRITHSSAYKMETLYYQK